ncbi:MAG: TlpA family protein disulfide reductase [Clostridia bacterium]|nr:TlpA family protein disulfide reductase [Clostridia bacterium]
MKIKRIFSLLLALVITALLTMTSCSKDKAVPAEISVAVTSSGGMIMPDVRINVYSDIELTDLVWAAETDSEGKTSFRGKTNTTYYAVLSDLPSGYFGSESYEIVKEHTNIVLGIELLSDEDLADTTFGLGSVFYDFTVTDASGTTHTLSELLKSKKAVVLNFWYINCGPCKMEFPYLEKAYGQYSEDIEVIAVNPIDGTDDKLLAYAKDNSLSLPMAVGDMEWESLMSLTAYPTTVVIDRYGTIGFIHRGSITEEGEFEKVFEFFTSDDYRQTTVRNISDIK